MENLYSCFRYPPLAYSRQHHSTGEPHSRVTEGSPRRKEGGGYFLYTWESENFKTLWTPWDISLNKHKLMYKVLAPSIMTPYKFLWAYGGSGLDIYVSVAG